MMQIRNEHWTGKEIAILLTVLAVSFLTLLQPRFLPAFDTLAEADERHTRWSGAYNNAKVQFPNLPSAEVTRIADIHLLQVTDTEEFTQAVAKRATEYRAGAQDRDGIPYLMHPDAYLYLRYAQEILQKGHPGESIPESAQYVDQLRHAPLGEPIAQNPLPYILAMLSKVVRILVPTLHMIDAMALYPLFAGMLLTVIVYGTLRNIAGIKTAQFGAAFLSLHPQFFAAFQWGYTDTNALNVLCSTSLFVLAYLTIAAKSWRWKSAAAVGACMVYWFFRAVWSPAIFFGVAAVGILTILAIMRIWRYLPNRQWRICALGGIVLAGSIGAFVLSAHPLAETALRYFGGGSAGGVLDIFPYVSEARSLRVPEILGAISGSLPIQGMGLTQLLLSASVMLILIAGIAKLCRGIRDPEVLLGAMFLLLWLAVLAYPATRLRFLQFAIIPIAMVIGVGAVWWSERFERWITHASLPKMHLGILVVGMVLALSIVPSTVRAIQQANPMMNDALVSVAERIKADSPTEAIIATWWNEGYLYQYAAERRTYFDGASVESLDAYWLSRYFLESDRKIARQILQGMSCNEYALYYLSIAFPENTMENMNAMLQMNHNRAEAYLRIVRGDHVFIRKYGEQKALSESLFPKLYCDAPPETYVVLSEAHLGTVWAFDWYRKVDFENPKQGTSGRSELNGATLACNTAGMMVVCAQGVTVDLTKGKAKDTLGKDMPFFFNNGTHLYRPQEDVPPNKPVLILYIDDNRLRGALINSDILNSMLVKLLFFNGEGMPEYEKVAEASGPYQPRIVAYRVNFAAEI